MSILSLTACRHAPLVIETPRWMDMRGTEVAAADSPALCGDDWVVTVTRATDRQGWQYGTSFAHLANIRQGGRSSQRSTGALL